MKKQSVLLFLILLVITSSSIAQTSGWLVNKTTDVGLSTIKATKIYVADINNDDYPDIIALNDANKYNMSPLKVLLNVKDTNSPLPDKRIFQDITTESGVNKNPNPDTTGRRTHMAALADVNNDGNIDLVTGIYYGKKEKYSDNGDRCEFFLGDGTGKFTLQSYTSIHNLGFINATGFSFLDFNRDGKIDLFISKWYADSTATPILLPYGTLLKGNGDGTFADVSTTAGFSSQRDPMMGCSVTDWNNDGWPDILTNSIYKSGGQLWKNNQNSTFTNVASLAGYDGLQMMGDNGKPMYMSSVVPEDFDNDQDMDMLFVMVHGGNDINEGRTTIVTNGGSTDNYNLLWELNRLKWDLPKSTHHGDFDASWFDMDNDGLEDIVMTQGYYMPGFDRTYFFKQNTSKYFDDVSSELGLVTSTDYKSTLSVEVLDYDLDGDEDIILSKQNELNRVVFLENKQGQTSNWVAVKLLPPQRVNQSGIGTKIKVYSGALVKTREVYAGRGNFGGQQPFITYFGLGGRSKIDSIQVFWPDQNGSVTTSVNPPINKILKINDFGHNTDICKSNQLTDQIRLYPNPASNHILIELSTGLSVQKLDKVEIMNLNGQVIEGSKTISIKSNTLLIDINTLPAGYYFVKVTTADGFNWFGKFAKIQ